jgi:hypothetical protein
MVAQKEYDKLIEKAVAKTPVRKMSLTEAKKSAYKLIDRWSSGK